MTEQTTVPETAAGQTGRPALSPPMIIFAVVVLLAVLFSAFFSFRSNQALAEVIAQEGLTDEETREDDVRIMGEYWIRSTLPISDAYRSGDDSRLDDKEKATLDMAAQVLDEIITEDMTPYEKELAVYEWMVSKLTYDTGVLQVIPNTEEDCDNPYGTLKYHNAVCVGYATTFRLFMQMMDIPCMVVHNTDAYHSWDLVQLDDDWYHVDIYSDQNSGNYANFNMNDEMASQGHTWDRDFFPSAEGTKFNYAIQNAQPVEDLYAIPNLVREALDKKDGAVFLDFKVIDEAHAQIAETMLSGVRDRIDESEDYQMVWIDWNWQRVSGTEYVLAVYLSGYEEDDSDRYSISDEDREKIDQAIEEAFGSAPDWEDVDYENDTADSGSITKSKTVTYG